MTDDKNKTDAGNSDDSVTVSLSAALIAVKAAQVAHGLEIAAKLDELKETVMNREMLYPSGMTRTMTDLVNVANITAQNLRSEAGQ